MEIFKLFGSVMVDTEKANESLNKTDDKAKGVGESLAKGAKKAGIFAAGVATAAVGAVKGLTDIASNTADVADGIDKASQRMKMGVESYQELAHAASLSGVEMSTLEKAAKKLEGTDLNMDDALEQIYALETAEERSAKAAELFGDSIAYTLTPMLAASGEEFAAMKQEAQDLGLVMSEDAVKSGAELGDAMANVKDSMGALANGIGASLMPVVKDVADLILKFVPTLREIISNISPTLSELLSGLVPVLFDVVKQIMPPLLKLMETLMPIFSALCETVLPLLAKLIEGVAFVISDIVIPVVDAIVVGVKEAVENTINNFNNLKDKAVEIFNAIKEGIKKPVNAVIGMINSMIDALNALSFDVPDWVPVLGGKSFGFNLENIPLLAEGGTVKDSGKAIVGEAGAELIDLPAGAKVTPLTGDNGLRSDEILATMKDMLKEMKKAEESIVIAIGSIDAGITDKEVFASVKRSAKAYKEQTGKLAFM